MLQSVVRISTAITFKMLSKMCRFYSILARAKGNCHIPLIRESRGISSNRKLLDLYVTSDGIAIISLDKPPVNSLCLDMFQEINKNLDIAQDNEYKGIIFTSAFAKIFSAGIDLNELINPNPNRLHLLWSTLQDMVLKLYVFGATTTVAINGYTAAGGCVLNLICDYRVMIDDGKSRIGLNDSAVGIVPRPWVSGLMERVINQRQTEIALIGSTMYTAEEALKINLIDETASDKEEAIEKCKEYIRKHDNIPLEVRSQVKRTLREPIIKMVEENRENDIKAFTENILNSFTQKQINKYTQLLKQKNK